MLNFLKRSHNKIDSQTYIVGQGRDDYLYKEGKKRMKLFAELGFTDMTATESVRVIDINSIKQWLPPYDNEIVTEEDKKRILKNFCQFFDQNEQKWALE